MGQNTPRLAPKNRVGGPIKPRLGSFKTKYPVNRGAHLDTRQAQAVIPAKTNRRVHIPHDVETYQWRHLIENYFSKIKEFRGINTRYDKTDASYQASWNRASNHHRIALNVHRP